jgi:hypothetical protein
MLAIILSIVIKTVSSKVGYSTTATTTTNSYFYPCYLQLPPALSLALFVPYTLTLIATRATSSMPKETVFMEAEGEEVTEVKTVKMKRNNQGSPKTKGVTVVCCTIL